MRRRSFLAGFVALAAAPLIPFSKSPALPEGGWTQSETFLRPGDTFTIQGVYAVNPPGVLQEFVVTAEAIH